MNCSVCATEIKENYCPKCGQYFSAKRVTLKTIAADVFDSVFSLERSFLKNLEVALKQAATLPTNYWQGYRKYYFSPGKFFAIASLFLLLHYSIANKFLGIVVSSNISSQFVILFTNIFLLTLLSYLIYAPFKRNIFEHLILNIYNVCLWIILFVPVSVLLSVLIGNNTIEQFFFIAFHLLVIIWNAQAFPLSKIKRAFLVALNLVLLYGALFFIVYTSGEF